MSKTENPTEKTTEILMLAYLCIKDLGGLRQKVEVLDRFGLAISDIARICGCNEQAVRDARHDLKESKSKKKDRES